MSAQIHVNQYLVREVTAERITGTADLVTVQIEEAGHKGHVIRTDVVAVESVWQQVADRLAALGIVGQVEGVA